MTSGAIVVEQRQRQLHDLARHAVGVPKLLDVRVGAVPAGAAGPRPSGGRAIAPVACATSPRIVSEPSPARRAIIRSCIGVRSWASSTIT